MIKCSLTGSLEELKSLCSSSNKMISTPYINTETPFTNPGRLINKKLLALQASIFRIELLITGLKYNNQ